MIILSSRADRGRHAWGSAGATQPRPGARVPVPRARVLDASAARRLGKRLDEGRMPGGALRARAPMLPEPPATRAQELRWLDMDALEAAQHRERHWANQLYEQSQAVKRDVACSVVSLAILSALVQLVVLLV